MRRHRWRMCIGVLLAAAWAQPGCAQKVLTWQDTQREFWANNPQLAAGRINIDESKADEVTAFLRPNPTATIVGDDLGFFSYQPFRPTANAILSGSVDYLYERQHKRDLRLQSARQATAIAVSTQGDLERNLMFNLRDAFVRVLLAKSIRGLAQENLNYYTRVIEINRTRLQAGDMSRVDFDRIELQRVQYESDLATAEVNLRTAKIDLLQFIHDRTPVDQFDVSGAFDYARTSLRLDELHATALSTRPDLREAQQSVEKAKTDHRLAVANGTADPTIGVDVGRQPPLSFYTGVSVSVPLRIFDKNQGEKLRTELDIKRAERLRDAAENSVFHDVDAAYESVQSTLRLLEPYKSRYLAQAANVRDTVSFAYQHGAASLIDFLDAQKEYRNLHLSYMNLVGAYLSAANQLNFAVGREVVE